MRYETTTTLAPDATLAAAERFFGGSFGLTVRLRSPQTLVPPHRFSRTLLSSPRRRHGSYSPARQLLDLASAGAAAGATARPGRRCR